MLDAKMKKGIFVTVAIIFFGGLLISYGNPLMIQEDYENIGNDSCIECHESGKHETVISEDISHSVHDGMECLDCHIDKNTLPHKEATDFFVGCQGCRTCHEDASDEYQGHGRALYRGECEDMPQCADCHGDHDVLPSTAKLSKTHPTNLPTTCGVCHTDLDLIEKWHIRADHPIDVYESSIHGRAIEGGVLTAATCNNCHSVEGTAHKIFSQGNPESSINHFNIPQTCGQCHEDTTHDYWEGIHGQMVKMGDGEAPVCTHCHGEHGIISASDPRSPVSRARLSEATCSPCHESITLTEKYGISTGRRPTFIDNYHGLKTTAGDVTVANCASCHGVHLILPGSDPKSSVSPENLRGTCGECHPGITAELASTPIHGVVAEREEPNKVADVIKMIYIVAIIGIVGFMLLYCLIDWVRQVVAVMRRPQVRRMRLNEVWQHTLLMVSFIVLVITGFALRYGDLPVARWLFGWDHGFEVRGIIHRIAAAVLIISTVWHVFFLLTQNGKRFFKDMIPTLTDFKQFAQKMLFNLGLSKTEPQFKRFSYVEKVEYFALIWGNIVMILTGILLWFDNYFVNLLPKGSLDVALVIHFYEAILATLAIFIWHLYATVFNPHVYPLNPSWLTGKMPRDMFEHEHPGEEPEEIGENS